MNSELCEQRPQRRDRPRAIQGHPPSARVSYSTMSADGMASILMTNCRSLLVSVSSCAYLDSKSHNWNLDMSSSPPTSNCTFLGYPRNRPAGVSWNSSRSWRTQPTTDDARDERWSLRGISGEAAFSVKFCSTVISNRANEEKAIRLGERHVRTWQEDLHHQAISQVRNVSIARLERGLRNDR